MDHTYIGLYIEFVNSILFVQNRGHLRTTSHLYSYFQREEYSVHPLGVLIY
jgi:hypothetical protein